MVASLLHPALVASSLQTQGVTEGVDRLATSGPLGLALVVVTLALIWSIKKLLDAKDSNTTEAKANTGALLTVSDKTNAVANTVNQTLVLNNEKLERVEEALRENTEVLREVNEALRSMREQRMIRR